MLYDLTCVILVLIIIAGGIGLLYLLGCGVALIKAIFDEWKRFKRR